MPYLGLSSVYPKDFYRSPPSLRSSIQKIRPKLASVKRNEEGERSEDFLFERSEFNVSASRTQSHACMSFAEAPPNFTFGVNLQRTERME